MSDKLNPCPSCDGDELKCEPLDYYGPFFEDPVFAEWVIKCICGYQTIARGKEKVIAAWNKQEEKEAA